VTLKELRAWHWDQFVDACRARRFAGANLNKAAGLQGQARRAAYDNFDRLAHHHAEAVKALDAAIPGRALHSFMIAHL
jgi:hypothetical protein